MKLNKLALYSIAFAVVFLTGCAKQPVPDSVLNQIVPPEESTEIQMEPELSQDEYEQMTNSGELVVKNGEKLDLTMTNYTFSASTIRAKAGDTFTVIVKTVDGYHDFVIDELDVKSKQLSSGETVEIQITIPSDASGKTFEYYCSVQSHRKMGMVGKLIIE